MIGCSGDGDGVFGGAPRLDCPNACMKLFNSPVALGTLSCIAMGMDSFPL